MTGTDLENTRLTPEMRQAAVLEGAGMDRARIATLLDISPRTVTRYKGSDEYKALVAHYEEKQVAELEVVIARVQAELAAVAVKAIRGLEQALDATSKEGNPRWEIRMQAISKALENLALAPKSEGDSGQAAAAAYIRVEVPDGSKTDKPEMIDGHATES